MYRTLFTILCQPWVPVDAFSVPRTEQTSFRTACTQYILCSNLAGFLYVFSSRFQTSHYFVSVQIVDALILINN